MRTSQKWRKELTMYRTSRANHKAHSCDLSTLSICVVNVAATTSPVVAAIRATLISLVAVIAAAFATLPAVYWWALRSLTIRGTIGSVASGKSDGCTSRRRLCCAPKEIGNGIWCVSVVRTGAYRVGSAWIWVDIEWVQIGVVVVRVALQRIVLENMTVGAMQVE
jgi:hypothetical protein